MRSSLIKMSLPLIFVMILMTAGVYGQETVEINYNPPYVCALKGSNVKLSCSFLNLRGQEIKTTWTKSLGKSSDVCSGNPGRAQCFSEDNDTYSMTLMNVTEADKHIYYCSAQMNKNKSGSTGTFGAQLNVTDLQVETQQSVKEGHSVNLTCKSSCSLTEQTTFIWYRNTDRLTDRTVNHLHLQSVSRSDAGNYRCAVREHEHLMSPPVYLNVEYPPRRVSVSVSPSGEIVEGDSVTLRCSSDSNPPAQISWFKGTKPLKSGETYSISKISSDDSGEYKCRSSNKHGVKNSDIVMLNVMYPPKNVSVSVSPSGEIMDSVTLNCSSDSNPPALNFSWFKEDQSSAVGSGQTFSAVQSGRFYCEAHNQHGSQRSESVSVTVQESSSSWIMITVGITTAVVLMSVILIVVIWLSMRHNKKVESPEDAYMTLDPKSRCSEYDTLDNVKRCCENTDSPEDQDPVYYNIGR